MNKLLNALTVPLKVISLCGSFSHATMCCSRWKQPQRVVAVSLVPQWVVVDFFTQ
jgi:hypothetical protein